MSPVEDGTDEVVKGALRFLTPRLFPYAEVIDELTAEFHTQVDRKKVQVLSSNFGLMISREPLTCRSLDMAVYWKNLDRIEDGLHYAPPDLVIEVLSPSENRRRKQEMLEDLRVHWRARSLDCLAAGGKRRGLAAPRGQADANRDRG